MLLVKFDSQLALTTPSGDREEVPYLRGTVVQTQEGFEALQNQRVRVYGDRNPEILNEIGQWAHIEASITGRVEMDNGKSSFTLDDVVVTSVLSAEDGAALRAELSKAQLAQLIAAQPIKLATAKRPGIASAAAGVKPAAQLATAGSDF